jgi:hypothetical protein
MFGSEFSGSRIGPRQSELLHRPVQNEHVFKLRQCGEFAAEIGGRPAAQVEWQLFTTFL